VGESEVPPADLVANPLNWRTHPKRQVDALGGLLGEVGWVQRVIVNRTTGHVVDGHARVALATTRGEATVPVVYVELTPEEERLVLASLDPIGALAGCSREALDTLLTDVTSDDVTLRSVLDDLRLTSGILDIEDYARVTETADQHYERIVVDRVESEIAERWHQAFRAAEGSDNSQRVAWLLAKVNPTVQ
jgi:hypothetical protein